jgi:sugar lactone lactonase YvrE
VFDRTGSVVRTFGEADGLSFPNGIAVDAAGNAYVADSNNGRLLVYDPTGQVIARVGRGSSAGSLGLPRGVVLDKHDRVFVVDTTGQGVSIYRIPAADQSRPDHLGRFGDQGVGEGQFEFPNGVAADDRGRVYITDTGNDRVQVWSY